MSPTLRDLLHTSAVERRADAEIVGRKQVLQAIGDRLRVEPEGAELVARIVLAAAQTWLPRKELDQLKLQLAADLRSLWVSP